MEYRNAKYNKHGTIDCEVNHPQFGWVPFTCSKDDPEPMGREMFNRLERIADQYKEGE